MNDDIKKYHEFIVKVFILIAFIVIGFIVYNILNIIFILFFSLFLSVLIAPFLNFLNRKKINNLLGILIIFILLLATISIIMFSVVPLVASQSSNFLSSIIDTTNKLRDIYNTSGIQGFGFPPFLEGIIGNLNIEELLDVVRNNLLDIGSFIGNNFGSFLVRGAGIIEGFTGAIFNFSMILIFTFFIALERKQIRKVFYFLLPKSIAIYIYRNETKIVSILGNWFKGQALLGLAMFILTLIGLGLLKIIGIEIEGIFTLALIAGFMEFIPYIGTFFSIFIALIVALGGGLEAVIGVLIVYLIIQQIEGNILVPYVMGRILTLTPFLVLLSMIIGGSLFGILGIIFAVPVISVLQIFLKPYLAKKKKLMSEIK